MSTHHPSKPSEERKHRKSAFAEISSAAADSAAMLRRAHARGEGPPPRRAEGRARRFRTPVPGPRRRAGEGQR